MWKCLFLQIQRHLSWPPKNTEWAIGGLAGNMWADRAPGEHFPKIGDCFWSFSEEKRFPENIFFKQKTLSAGDFQKIWMFCENKCLVSLCGKGDEVSLGASLLTSLSRIGLLDHHPLTLGCTDGGNQHRWSSQYKNRDDLSIQTKPTQHKI